MTDKIATLDDFRPQVEEFTLPSQAGSGKVVRLRRPDLVALINEDGEAPNALAAMVLNTAGPKKDTNDTETVRGLFALMDRICVAAFVEPQLTEQPEPEGDKVPVSWLSFADKEAVFTWSQGTMFRTGGSVPQE